VSKLAKLAAVIVVLVALVATLPISLGSANRGAATTTSSQLRSGHERGADGLLCPLPRLPRTGS
jgi:hypothetical protein